MHFSEYDTRLAAYAVIVDEREQILLSWYNGSTRGRPGWTLPGGGVDLEETAEEAVVREVHEETGYDVELDGLLTVHSSAGQGGPRPPRPFKSVRVVYTAHVVGGSLGTVEVGGTTDHAAWMPLDAVAGDEPRVGLVDVAIEAWRGR
ncbi:NUDIX hydrolase [Solicola sp. PLA-1-18]|uniref:NUDIX hydrolase n=1 Tax=Solicola sp. PLA-1-18 TaxID=3380532 RepID=UPI003B7E141D